MEYQMNNWNSTRRRKEKIKAKLGYLPEGWRDMKLNCIACENIPEKLIQFAPLPKAVPCEVMGDCPDSPCVKIKKEGKTPMRYNDNYAHASVTAPKSDAAVQREYLLERLDSAYYPKVSSFETLFNLYVDNSPKTYKQLIDAIKNGKYTIDPKVEKRLAAAEEENGARYWHSMIQGIIWDGPQPDQKGYEKALEDLRLESTKARDIIMTGDAAAGLAALQAFEAWTPVTAS